MDHTTNQSAEQENATDAATIENQARDDKQVETKSYTQEEVDNMMARMKGSLEHKLLKPYEGLGNPDELRELKSAHEQRTQEEQLKRGEFEKTLQDIVAKKDAEISKRDGVIKEYKVNSPLMDSAAKHKAVAPEQVRSLLANQVRLGESGEVEVVDINGAVRYNDSGAAYGVDDLVREFIDANPHFGNATPATTNTKSNLGANNPSKLNIGELDMTNPEHRKLYAEYRKSAGLA